MNTNTIEQDFLEFVARSFEGEETPTEEHIAVMRICYFAGYSQSNFNIEHGSPDNALEFGRYMEEKNNELKKFWDDERKAELEFKNEKQD
jgi:hypothetical protein